MIELAYKKKSHSGLQNCLSLQPTTGNYTCEVEWRGQPIHITHQLVVLVPPSIWAVMPNGQPNRPIEAREGSSVQLECQAEGIPPPVIRWRRPVSSKNSVFLSFNFFSDSIKSNQKIFLLSQDFDEIERLLRTDEDGLPQ